MSNNIELFVGITILAVLIFITSIIMRRQELKKEIRVRRKKFEEIRNGDNHQKPRVLVMWLNHRLMGRQAIASDTLRSYYINLADLGISFSEYQETIMTLFGAWWKELKDSQPTLSDALNPYHYFDSKFSDIKSWMPLFEIKVVDVEKNEPLLITNCTQNCCAMLENALQFFPETPGTKPSAGELQEALQEHWISPTHELHKKWQGWVKAAYLRQANHVLLRLRGGHYPFPESDNQVNKIITFLVCAKAEHDAIGTSPAELHRLRGFMTSV